MENRKKDNLDWVLGTNYSSNNTTYSINTELNQKFVNRRYYANVTTFLGKWTLNTSFNYNIYGGGVFGGDQIVPLWNASISRTFLKFDRGELKFSAFDLMNENQGINRTSQLNYIEEQQFNTLARYFMFSFTYNLSKFGGGNKPMTIDIRGAH